MPPTVEDRLRDILEAISEIEEMLVGSSLDAFTTDKMRRMATERYLEVICEAARRLTDDVKREAPNIDWRKMIDLAMCCGTRITQPGSISSGTLFRTICRP
jgi:uncharacterized protein with HEPN domain